MKRPLSHGQPAPGPTGSARARQTHPLLSAFPLAVMMLGTLIVLFALIMTLSADSDGAARQSTNSSHLVRSLVPSPAATSSVATSSIGMRALPGWRGR
jgi:hypothetical protein